MRAEISIWNHEQVSRHGPPALFEQTLGLFKPEAGMSDSETTAFLRHHTIKSHRRTALFSRR